MANQFADTSAPVWGSIVQTAYDRSVEYVLRDDPQWRQLIDKHPVEQAMPGSTVTLTLHKDFANLPVTPLAENIAPDTVSPQSPNQVNVVLQEYGNPTQWTIRLANLAFTKPDMELAYLIGRNMADTHDQLVRSVADAGTNLLYINGGVLKSNANGGVDGSIVATDLFNRNCASGAVTLLHRRKTNPKMGGKYVALIHPDVQFDLMAENSATAWIGVHTYGTDTQAVYAGEVGELLGARYIPTTRITSTNTGSAGGKVYNTYFLGAQALVEAAAVEPHIVVGNQTDSLKRYWPIGWHSLLGWNIYRQEALQRVHTSSSIAAL